MDDVRGKKVLITGGGMGLGRIFARLAVEGGASDVVLWDIDDEAMKETAEGLAGRGTQLHTYNVDVSDNARVTEAGKQVISEVGAPHVVFNNAGIVRGNSYFWETGEDNADSQQTIAINALAPMYVTRVFLPEMIAQSADARIVNIASAAGFVANPRMAVYAASKWAAIGFSDSVRLELEQAGHDHVKVTTVCPYYIKTGMFEGAKSALLVPLLEPEDVCAEVWDGMLSGKPMVIMPKTVALNETMKGILPVRLRDFISDKIGIHNSMDDFKGRTKS